MKRIVLKLATLAVLIGSGTFLISSEPAAAALTSCWESAYNKWNACDGAYSNTVTTYHDSSYCTTRSASECSEIANSYCSSQAATTCSGNSNYQSCYNNAYTSCHGAAYGNCFNTHNSACLSDNESSYNNRSNNYASCLGVEGNLGNCIEQMQNGCDAAQSRVYVCAAVYADSEDADAYWTCRSNSGIDQCQ